MDFYNITYKIFNYFSAKNPDTAISNEKLILDLSLNKSTFDDVKIYLSQNDYLIGGKTHIGISTLGRQKFAEIQKAEAEEIYETVFDDFEFTVFKFFYKRSGFVSLSEIPASIKNNVPEKIGLNDFPIMNYLHKNGEYFDYINRQYLLNENGKAYYLNLKKKMESKKDTKHTIVHASGGSVVTIGDSNKVNVTINKTADLPSLIERLKELQIQDTDISDLTRFIDSEKPADQNTEFGTKTKTWISKMLAKSLDGTWQIGIATAGGVLVEVIKKYYGI